MFASVPARRAVARGLSCLVVIALSGLEVFSAGPGARDRAGPSRTSAGRALFEKSWETREPGQGQGDGLGPLFNQTSCVACHHQGGTGGGGEATFNVHLITARWTDQAAPSNEPTFRGRLDDLHPGFRDGMTLILHQFAGLPDENDLLKEIKAFRYVKNRDGVFQLERSQRNTPALFGSGLIDAISDSVLLEAEKRRWPSFPEVRGRVSRLADGTIGRFGWKGQISRLSDFVLSACSGELGLDVPGHHQVSVVPERAFVEAAPRFDLSPRQCSELTYFVRELPAPVIRPVKQGLLPYRGRETFEAIGCATCHTPKLGTVDGLYSDLLLHNVEYTPQVYGGGFCGTYDRAKPTSDPIAAADTPTPAGPIGWRTPPLWGVARSAPYWHDGRAKTLDEAIRLHGGEADAIRKRYERLTPMERQAVLAFLRSLVAPPVQGSPAAVALKDRRCD
jgi:CxxC motif-containing protein (DUF1111 family)